MENDLKSFAKSLGTTQPELLDYIRTVTDYVYRSYTSKRETDDDLYQEVMVVLLRKLKDPTFPPDYIRYQEPLSFLRTRLPSGYFPWPSHLFLNWVYSVARNQIRNGYRRKRRVGILSNRSIKRLERNQEIQFPFTRTSSQLDELIAKDEIALVLSKLASELPRLSVNLREIASLRYFHGLAFREIASVLATDERVVRKLVRKVDDRIKTRLAGVVEPELSRLAQTAIPRLEFASAAPEGSVDLWLDQTPPLRINQGSNLWVQVSSGSIPFRTTNRVVKICAYMFSSGANIYPRYQDLELWSDRVSDPICYKLTPNESGLVEVNLSLYLKRNMHLVEEHEFSIEVLSETVGELAR